MKTTLFVILLSFSSSFFGQSFAQSFEQEAALLSKDLKQNLVKNLTDKMQQDGTIPALEFCHINVSALAKTAAGERMANLEFGRTSHKVRNPKNAAAEWMLPYLDQFKVTNIKSPAKPVVHQFKDGKKAYLDPLYVGPQCMTCHGSPAKELSAKVMALYPEDKAVGFKLGEFRGMIWIKEK